uniref:Remorin C-terminal domain-containing protein n=1 Tax=Kalanchoe fedtschenkoi TaxID=63787 RepID=A0A7N0TPN0_KALFE
MNDPPTPPQRTLSGTSHQHRDPDEGEAQIREIHALQTPPRGRPWEETSSHVSSNSLSMASDNFTTMSREFSALVVAGSTIRNDHTPSELEHHGSSNMSLAMIGEGRDEVPEETNPLAIVHQQDLSSRDTPPVASPGTIVAVGPSSGHGEISVQRVKKEEVESKITAWQNAKIAKINNRFKREDAIIGGWENAQVDKASASMKKVERKLEEKRARALEKMQNDIAKARRKAEEKRASAEAKRGTKAAKVFEICNLMRAVGRAPSKRSFF